MKIYSILTGLFVISGNLSLAQITDISVTKNNAPVVVDKKSGVATSNAEFHLTIGKIQNSMPTLIIPTISSAQTRVSGARVKGDRVEVVIQVDEFYLEYMVYNLENSKWTLKFQKKLCSLNGQISTKIAQVDILDEGIIDVKLHNEESNPGKSGWDKELLMKDHKEERDMITERYALKDGLFSLVGEASKYRSKPDTKTEENQEQNKTQQDNR